MFSFISDHGFLFQVPLDYTGLSLQGCVDPWEAPSFPLGIFPFLFNPLQATTFPQWLLHNAEPPLEGSALQLHTLLRVASVCAFLAGGGGQAGHSGSGVTPI